MDACPKRKEILERAGPSCGLIDILPKGLTWPLSFWVMAMFWLAQVRLYRLSSGLDWPLVWLELMQLASISLLPFSTALPGEHGGHVTAAALYGANLVLIAWLSWLRTSHFPRGAGGQLDLCDTHLRRCGRR